MVRWEGKVGVDHLIYLLVDHFDGGVDVYMNRLDFNILTYLILVLHIVFK